MGITKVQDEMTNTVTAKGQVTIPKPVRDLLGIVPGSKVDFRRIDDGNVVASLDGPLLINDAVYAELAVRYDRIESIDAFLDEAGLQMAPMPRAALFLAGKVFTQYRKSGGSRTGVLPDFFIGAHAAVNGLPLLTRDVGRYRTYFPSLKLIAPGA
jgi:AbrB family looped-hinge helix DNA binding protein